MTAPQNPNSIEPSPKSDLKIKLSRYEFEVSSDGESAPIVEDVCATFGVIVLQPSLLWMKINYDVSSALLLAMDLIATCAVVIFVVAGRTRKT